VLSEEVRTFIPAGRGCKKPRKGVIPWLCVTISERLAKVTLQGIVNHTAQRICDYSKEVLESISEINRKNLVLISKWGCDGSGSQAIYKQRTEQDFNESSVLMTCLVPLQLVSLQDSTR